MITCKTFSAEEKITMIKFKLASKKYLNIVKSRIWDAQCAWVEKDKYKDTDKDERKM